MHTNYSDGADPPHVVVERALEAGVGALAVTDHDAVGGLAEARASAEERGVAFVSGVEITTEYDRIEVHVVGLGVDPASGGLLRLLETLAQERAKRMSGILERLDDLGIALPVESVEARTRGAVGRMHIAQELLEQGQVRTVQEAFDKYIGRGKDAYLPSGRVSCREAVEAIHAARGLAFVGHPGLGGVRKKLPQLLTLPFDGIEAYHSHHRPGRVAEFIELAESRSLLVGGGSDCHGRAKGKRPLMGKVRVPWDRWLAVREALAAR